MTRTIRLAASAEADIVGILAHSEEEFGPAARIRYEHLLGTALRDIAEAPDRPGSSARPELGKELRSWHLRHSRDRARSASVTVSRPRHSSFTQ